MYNYDFHYALFKQPLGIHGIAHSLRVSILCYKLFNDEDLIFPSLYHDIGRRHNGNCTNHGIWSLEKLITNNISFSTRSAFIIENHCKSDSRADKDSPFYSLLLKFKDADALDRVRDNSLNYKFLRTKEALDNIELSRYLVKLPLEELIKKTDYV